MPTAADLVARGRVRADELAEAAARVKRFLGLQVGVTAVETRPTSDLSAVSAEVWVADSPSGLPRRALPDGTPVTELNDYETNYLYEEIFVEEVYATQGGDLPAAPVVLDVGANIGMFSLYLARQRPGARIYAFEPAPDAFAALSANVTHHGLPVTCLPWGVGGRTGSGEMTVYPHAAVFSSIAGDTAADRAAIAAAIATAVDDDRSAGVVDQLADARMAGARTVPIEVVSLPDVLDRLGEARVDLLKLDAEGAETAILGALDKSHWARIDRIAMEVHQDAAVDDMTKMLTDAGYTCTVVSVPALRDTGYTNLSARRDSPAREAPRRAHKPRVAEHAPPSAYERLREAVRGLGVPVELTVHSGPARTAPGTRAAADFDPSMLSELAAIWGDVLGRDVGPGDDFFTAGGSSLAAVRMLGRVRQRFGGEVGLADLLSDPTLAALAARLSDPGAGS
ncbi:FkbM family methyltransferase [Streptomycetaceae bacterium NBC_01309]